MTDGDDFAYGGYHERPLNIRDKLNMMNIFMKHVSALSTNFNVMNDLTTILFIIEKFKHFFNYIALSFFYYYHEA